MENHNEKNKDRTIKKCEHTPDLFPETVNSPEELVTYLLSQNENNNLRRLHQSVSGYSDAFYGEKLPDFDPKIHRNDCFDGLESIDYPFKTEEEEEALLREILGDDYD